MDTTEIGQLLSAYGRGDRSALDRLIPAVYAELRRIARAQLVGEVERPLDTTGLVHEAYIRLADADGLTIENRSHFLSIAARAMRRILIDEARRRTAQKRGGAQSPVTIRTDALGVKAREEDLLALDQALERLSQLSPQQGRVVECRVFAGMTIPETADALGVSPSTVKREWSLARAWLNRALRA